MRPTHVSILKRVLLVVVLSLGGIVGCTSTGNSDPPWPAPRPLGRGIASYQAGPEPRSSIADSPAVPEPTGELTLRGALALALARNPALASFSWAIRSAEADVLQAGLGPNPEVRLSMRDFGGSGEYRGADGSEQSIRLAQVIELGRKADRRRQLARSATALCGWDYEALRLDVFTETAKAFIAVLVAERQVVLAEETRGVAQETVDALAKRAQGGMGSNLELSEARVELGTSRIGVERAKRAVARARGMLAACWGAEQASFTRVVGDLDALVDVPPIEQLLAQLKDNPDIARWDAEARLRQAAVDLEKANAVTDVRVLVSTNRAEDTGDHGFTAALEVSLPIFNRNQGAVRRARFDRVRVAHERHAAIMLARKALSEAYEMLSASHVEATMLKAEVLPAARQRADTSDRGLVAGAVKYSQAMKARRDLYDAKSSQIDALGDFHMALMDIERLIAQPITEDADEPDSPDE